MRNVTEVSPIAHAQSFSGEDLRRTGDASVTNRTHRHRGACAHVSGDRCAMGREQRPAQGGRL